MKNLRQELHKHLHLGRAQLARVEQRPQIRPPRAERLQHGHQSPFAQGLQHGDGQGLDDAAAGRLQLADYYRQTYLAKPAWQGI